MRQTSHPVLRHCSPPRTDPSHSVPPQPAFPHSASSDNISPHRLPLHPAPPQAASPHPASPHPASPRPAPAGTAWLRLLALLLLASSQAAAGFTELRHPGGYSFHYGVRDQSGGAEFSHAETRRQQVTVGRYSVRLPDGRTQTVRYTADRRGYRASVTYEVDPSVPFDEVFSLGRNHADSMQALNAVLAGDTNSRSSSATPAPIRGLLRKISQPSEPERLTIPPPSGKYPDETSQLLNGVDIIASSAQRHSALTNNRLDEKNTETKVVSIAEYSQHFDIVPHKDNSTERKMLDGLKNPHKLIPLTASRLTTPIPHMSTPQNFQTSAISSNSVPIDASSQVTSQVPTASHASSVLPVHIAQLQPLISRVPPLCFNKTTPHPLTVLRNSSVFQVPTVHPRLPNSHSPFIPSRASSPNIPEIPEKFRNSNVNRVPHKDAASHVPVIHNQHMASIVPAVPNNPTSPHVSLLPDNVLLHLDEKVPHRPTDLDNSDVPHVKNFPHTSIASVNPTVHQLDTNPNFPGVTHNHTQSHALTVPHTHASPSQSKAPNVHTNPRNSTISHGTTVNQVPIVPHVQTVDHIPIVPQIPTVPLVPVVDHIPTVPPPVSHKRISHTAIVAQRIMGRPQGRWPPLAPSGKPRTSSPNFHGRWPQTAPSDGTHSPAAIYQGRWPSLSVPDNQLPPIVRPTEQWRPVHKASPSSAQSERQNTYSKLPNKGYDRQRSGSSFVPHQNSLVRYPVRHGYNRPTPVTNAHSLSFVSSNSLELVLPALFSQSEPPSISQPNDTDSESIFISMNILNSTRNDPDEATSLNRNLDLNQNLIPPLKTNPPVDESERLSGPEENKFIVVSNNIDNQLSVESEENFVETTTRRPFTFDPEASVFHRAPSVLVDYTRKGSSHGSSRDAVSLIAPYVVVGGAYATNPHAKYYIQQTLESNPNSVASHGIRPADAKDSGNVLLPPEALPPHLATLRKTQQTRLSTGDFPLRDQPSTFGAGQSREAFTPNSLLSPRLSRRRKRAFGSSSPPLFDVYNNG